MHQLCMLLRVHTTCRHSELPIPSVLTASEWTMFGGATFTAEPGPSGQVSMAFTELWRVSTVL